MRRSDASGFSQGWFPPDLRQPRGRVFEGRLTATPGLDITTADVTAGTTLSYTESEGNLISLPWKPGKWEAFELPRTPAGVYEITKTFLASSPWAIASGSNYDVFGFLGPNGPDLELGPAWSSDTARSAAGALARRNGVRVLARDPSRVFLGTIRASGTNTIEDSAAKRFVWNMYNRRTRKLFRIETTGTWTYGTATWRQANADAANQVEVVTGLNEDGVDVLLIVSVASSGGITDASVGIGIDSTTPSGLGIHPYNAIVAGGYAQTLVAQLEHAALGYRAYKWCESSGGSGTASFYGENTYTTSGLSGNVLA